MTTVEEPPLCVDLDGTLISADLLILSIRRLVHRSPLALLYSLAFLVRGMAAFKQRVASQINIDPATLPYQDAVLAWVRAEAQTGRQVVLCTGSDVKYAVAVAGYLSCFTEVMASDGRINLVDEVKAQALCARYGQGKFDYAGNSHHDLPVWLRARRAIVVSDDEALIRKVKETATLEKVFGTSQ